MTIADLKWSRTNTSPRTVQWSATLTLSDGSVYDVAPTDLSTALPITADGSPLPAGQDYTPTARAALGQCDFTDDGAVAAAVMVDAQRVLNEQNQRIADVP